MIKKIICKECFASFSPLDKTDFMCPECCVETVPEPVKHPKERKPLDRFFNEFPPEEEGITWEHVKSPFKPYKEGV